MHSSTSNSESDLGTAYERSPNARLKRPRPAAGDDLDFVRPVPALPWKGILEVTLIVVTVLTIAWELNARAHGYRPSLNDTADLWAEQRAKVKPGSLVLAGTSRMLFNADLDVLEEAFGQRPVQLAMAGSSPFPVLADLAGDESFRGTLIVDIVPAMFLAPPGSPPMEVSRKALQRYHEWNHAQRWSHQLGMSLEEHVAFLKQEDLTLKQLLKSLPIPDRANAQIGPPLPPYFYTVDRERRGRMVEQAAVIGSPLQQRVAQGWLPLFTMPPPPAFIPAEQFQKMVMQAVEQRMQETAKHLATLRARGVKVVFVRMPVQGPLVEKEEALVPVAFGWGRLVQDNGVPAINFADHPELSSFILPEWSHLSAPDSIEFTKRLVPHLQRAVGTADTNATATLTSARPTSG